MEKYTPGHSENAVSFMSKRSLESHGAFFIDQLKPGLKILDIGCGPGTITYEIASRVAPGKVTGVDFAESQIAKAKSNQPEHISNLKFITGSCYDLPFQEHSFDAVFGHAIMEHLQYPVKALKELNRVLVPGGTIGICSPDWKGLLVAPESPELNGALDSYAKLQSANGGNLAIGHHFGTLLQEAGFNQIALSARYECYPSLAFIGDYLALQLEKAGQSTHAQTLTQWSKQEAGLFAQAWVSAIAHK